MQLHSTFTNNDAVLSPVIEAEDTAARSEAIADVITRRARTVIAHVLGPYRRSGFALSSQDFDDIASTVSLRLVSKLTALADAAAEPIERFDDYVAALTFNTAYDFFRRRYPKRARLKNRLRYIMKTDRRLAMWGPPEALVAGLDAWRGRGNAVDPGEMLRRDATAAMLDSAHPADAVAAILASIGAPVRFDDLVRIAAELWSVVDLREALGGPPSTPATQLSDAESRQTVRAVWREIRELPPPQRCALLLNLREGQEGNAVALLITSGIATLPEIASALEMSVSNLAEIWGRLPVDDRTIAERLGLTRQQVINLRKSARSRLERRLANMRRRSTSYPS
jgi:hypothetical protein